CVVKVSPLSVVSSLSLRDALPISDAMGAAGMGDGRYPLGPLEVEVRDGVARLAEGGSIAGSTLTLDRAFRRAVTVDGLPVEEAVDRKSTRLNSSHVKTSYAVFCLK